MQAEEFAIERTLYVRFPAILTHGIAAHLDAVGVVHEPVEDAVRQQRAIQYPGALHFVF